MNGSDRSLRWPGAFALLLATGAFVWLAAGLGRGLELTDEAYYLLYAIHARQIQLFFSPFHWVIGPLWEATGSLAAFRAAGLLLSVLGAAVLAAGLLRAATRVGLPVPDDRLGRAAVIATAVCGALLYGSLLNFTPSYNLMATIFGSLAVGLGLLSMGAHGQRAVLLALAAGVCVGLCFLSKVTSGICVAAMLAILWLALAQGRARANAAWAALAAAGAVVAMAQAWGGIGLALAQLRGGVDIWSLATDNRSASGQLLRSASDLGRMLAGAVTAFWVPLACFALALRLPYARLLRWVGALWFVAVLLAGAHFQGGNDAFTRQSQPLAAALLLALLAWLPAWTHDLRRLALVAVLAGLPAAIAVGTSNPLEVQVLSAMAPWGALVALFGFARPGLGAATAVSIAFSLTVLGQIATSGAQPYRMLPLAWQNEAIELPRLGSVRVDAATATLARQLREAVTACGVRPAQPFMDLYDAPGLALLLDANPLVGPWLSNADTASRVLARAVPEELRQALVAVRRRADGAPAAAPTQIASFPQGYRLCGTSHWPTDGARVELWAPQP